ncbi:MAG: nucleic acid binding [Trebouxia sp. A1-2]|nr:MAG: nucleic acid binding [Trebouxia sp. A1-2]
MSLLSTVFPLAGRKQQQREQHRSHPKRPVVNPNSKQAELLASVASDMNTFSNDGSFMDRFAALQTEGGADGQTGRPMPAEEEQLSLSDQHSDDESDEQQRPREAAGANQGAAAALRAKLQGTANQCAPAGDGNKATAAALRARLMQGKQPSMVLGPNPDSAQNSTQGSAAVTESRAKSVQLSAIDSEGRAVPGAFGRAAVGAGAPEGGRKPKRVQRFDAGERQRYFADDDKQQLGDLVAQQRYEGAADIDANLADNIMRKGKRFREKELAVDEEYDVDGGLDMYESRKKKGTKEQQKKRDRAAQIADHRRVTTAVDRCPFCFASTSRPCHLTISLGQTAYLALPARGRLGEGHSIIVPTEHVASTRQVDEHIWTELRNFKKCLLQMHMAQGTDVIFMETAMRLGDARTHAVVHCIPVPPKITAKAPLYFKKGIDDAESEWSQHHAKRMIETGGKGLRGSIPANFPYFHVEFNLTKGFVHVIDDEAKFDPQFGRSIMIGLLDLPAEDMHRQAKFESTQMQQQWVADFAKKWDAYDWTKQLG